MTLHSCNAIMLLEKSQIKKSFMVNPLTEINYPSRCFEMQDDFAYLTLVSVAHFSGEKYLSSTIGVGSIAASGPRRRPEDGRLRSRLRARSPRSSQAVEGRILGFAVQDAEPL